ncbi:hypothetical protein DFR62_0757 [Planococcus citreus]|uniref:Uncharacterized protein n=1 Tax=Planococcus citreus TaxID=1373 RepID=A0A497YQK2_9BACL|nr:hypothetical protein DFR62_0757 [Planococcus citreus]
MSHTICRPENLLRRRLCVCSSLCTTQFKQKKARSREGTGFFMEMLTDVHFVRVGAFAAVFVQPVDLVHVFFA